MYIYIYIYACTLRKPPTGTREGPNAGALEFVFKEFLTIQV